MASIPKSVVDRTCIFTSGHNGCHTVLPQNGAAGFLLVMMADSGLIRNPMFSYNMHQPNEKLFSTWLSAI